MYERYRQGKLNELPTGDLMRPLTAASTAWLEEKKISARTRRDYGEAWTRLAAPADATFTDLPILLAAHRKASLSVRARTFNKDRSALLTLARSAR